MNSTHGPSKGVAVRSATAGAPIRYYVVESDFCKQLG
jgi:hypothetical protein